MSGPPIDPAKIRTYLLGSAPTDDVEAVEAAYFGSADALAAVAGAEEDLIEDYLAGRLEAETRGLFERRYLASPVHRRRVALARELMIRARGRRAPSLLPLAVAAAILIAAVLGVVVLRGARSTKEAQGPPPAGAREATPGASDGPEPAAATIAIILPAGIVRGEGETPVLRKEAGARNVALRLERGGGGDAPPYRVTIRTVEGSEVWKGDASAPAAQEPSGPAVIAVATVPTASLPPGDYVVVLAGGVPESELQRYFFRVLTP